MRDVRRGVNRFLMIYLLSGVIALRTNPLLEPGKPKRKTSGIGL